MRGVGLFSSLVKSGVVEAKMVRLAPQSLRNQLSDIVADIQVLSDPTLNLQYSLLNRDICDSPCTAYGDPELLDIALRNILDNARKYSYPETNIIIEPHWSNRERFVISIRNIGLEVRTADASLCTQRGWRSETAMACTGEGSGLGLWIANQVMAAQGGELRIFPTRSDGITEVQLTLPTENVEGGDGESSPR